MGYSEIKENKHKILFIVSFHPVTSRSLLLNHLDVFIRFSLFN